MCVARAKPLLSPSGKLRRSGMWPAGHRPGDGARCRTAGAQEGDIGGHAFSTHMPLLRSYGGETRDEKCPTSEP
jgi:hypothetical protein